MSVTSRMILLSLLCLISLHACDARRLGEVVMKPEEKVEEKVLVGVEDKMIVGPKVKTSSTNEKRDILGDGSAVNVTVSTRKLKDTKALGSISNKDQKGKLSPAAVRTENVASVSWPVPHKKHGEKQPGFNLDYAPPKTHPPHHN